MEADEAAERQFLKYTFYKVQPEWRRLPAEEKKADKAELAAAIHDLEEEIPLR